MLANTRPLLVQLGSQQPQQFPPIALSDIHNMLANTRPLLVQLGSQQPQQFPQIALSDIHSMLANTALCWYSSGVSSRSSSLR